MMHAWSSIFLGLMSLIRLGTTSNSQPYYPLSPTLFFFIPSSMWWIFFFIILKAFQVHVTLTTIGRWTLPYAISLVTFLRLSTLLPLVVHHTTFFQLSSTSPSTSSITPRGILHRMVKELAKGEQPHLYFNNIAYLPR